MQHVLQALFNELAPLLKDKGYALLDIRWASSDGNRILRLYIDRFNQEEAVNIDDCACVSRLVDPILDLTEGFGGRYHLEVSSPGLARPLRTPESFGQAIGKMATIRLGNPQNGRRNFKGVILTSNEQTVTMKDDTGAAHTLPIEEIAEANLVWEERALK